MGYKRPQIFFSFGQRFPTNDLDVGTNFPKIAHFRKKESPCEGPSYRLEWACDESSKMGDLVTLAFDHHLDRVQNKLDSVLLVARLGKSIGPDVLLVLEHLNDDAGVDEVGLKTVHCVSFLWSTIRRVIRAKKRKPL